jgi:hypothetical protein
MSHASLTEPGCVAYNAIIEKSRPRLADHVVVTAPADWVDVYCRIALSRGGAH